MRPLLCSVATAYACLTGAACHTSPPPTPTPRTLRIVGTSVALGEALAGIYNDAIPDVSASAAASEVAQYNLKALEEGTAEVGFVRAEIAYMAFGRGTRLHPQPHGHLRGLAVVGTSVLHVLAANASPIRRLADLKGRRVGSVAASDEAVRRVRARSPEEIEVGLYESLLAATGRLPLGTLVPEPVTTEDATSALLNGTLDALLFLGPYPAPIATRLAGLGQVRFIDVATEEAARLREQFRFYKPTSIPSDTYAGQSDAVQTIGVDMLLLCREDLPEKLAYSLVESVFTSYPTLAAAMETIRTVEPEAAAATPIALHPGAARYYRERELPPH